MEGDVQADAHASVNDAGAVVADEVLYDAGVVGVARDTLCSTLRRSIEGDNRLVLGHPFLVLTVRSTMEMPRMQTQTGVFLRMLLSSGMTLPTTLAVPVEEGIMLHPSKLE